jgi:ankyrin repeat protein
MLLAAGANVDEARFDGCTPLWIASQMGHDHIVKILLQKGAFVDAIRNDGSSPLFKASHKGHSAVVHELLKYRPNLSLLPVSFAILLLFFMLI